MFNGQRAQPLLIVQASLVNLYFVERPTTRFQRSGEQRAQSMASSCAIYASLSLPVLRAYPLDSASRHRTRALSPLHSASCNTSLRFGIRFGGNQIVVIFRRKKPAVEVEAMSSSPYNVQAWENEPSTNNQPDHLLVLVHGILASPSDWTYFKSELEKCLGRRFYIYASACNSYTQTLHGIDVAGRRLADEVQEVITGTPSLKKISFLAHSLGGLFARYAISVLYQENEGHSSKVRTSTIGGLEAINFITLATPHLGVRGRKQLPILFGVPFLEKLVPPVVQFVTRRTGRQLFLTDGKASKAPLLLRMASDCEHGKFISSLAVFRSRILYANVSYDHIVGWRTSSIRRESELTRPPKRSLIGYKHIVNVAYCPPVHTDGPSYPPETAKAKEAAQISPSSEDAENYYESLEEQMIQGLQKVGWKKVDVSFHSAFWPFFAHNNIHVKQEWIHSAGAGVVAHVADSLKEQETSLISASL